ncbi:MAG: zf-TFIIB domain-containing protein [Elusimicrobiota bacterium]|nr:MAG: zf-TFIIB domain-containing protein [Elusimicrobiota bacterium]
MAERDCPKCPFSPMTEIQTGDLVVDECPQCKGRWFDFDELVKSVANPAAFQAVVAKGPLKPKPGEAKCPVCLENMMNGGFGSEFLRVDQCAGHGFWLDEAELRLLDKLLAS